MALARPVRLSWHAGGLPGFLAVQVARYRLARVPAGIEVLSRLPAMGRVDQVSDQATRRYLPSTWVPSLTTPFRSFGLRPSAARIVGAIWVV